MTVAASALADYLDQTPTLAPFWLVTGAEELLKLESADLLRARARALGYCDRQVLEMSASSDWSQLMDSAASIGMFAEQKLLEVRLAGKPGVRGAPALERFVQTPFEGVVTVFTAPKPDWQGEKAGWWQALVRASTVIDCSPVPREQLPRWLAQRLSKNGQHASQDALERFADLVEGNLLAAKQEVAKLSLLFPAGEITAENIDACVSNSSRYGTDALIRSTLLGEADRVARIVDGLEAQAEPFPLILMMLTMQLRSVIRLRATYDRRENFARGVFRTPELDRAARRLKPQRVAAALAVCADIDRISKGIPVPGRDSNPWIELKSVCLFLAAR